MRPFWWFSSPGAVEVYLGWMRYVTGRGTERQGAVCVLKAVFLRWLASSLATRIRPSCWVEEDGHLLVITIGMIIHQLMRSCRSPLQVFFLSKPGIIMKKRRFDSTIMEQEFGKDRVRGYLERVEGQQIIPNDLTYRNTGERANRSGLIVSVEISKRSNLLVIQLRE